MRRQARAALLSVALLLPSPNAGAQPGAEPPSLELQKSFGCLASGTAGTIAAIGFGPENLVNLVSGGIVTPANSAVLAIGVVGVVFASFCSVGESLTPSVLYMADHAAPAATRLADAAAEALEAATATARATGTALAETLPTLDTTIEAAEATLAATQRLATTALATATEALEAARTATPTAWAESGWNALSDLCRQSPFCSSRITVAPR